MKDYKTKEEAFTEAASLRRKYNVLIEGPDGDRYDEVAITDWCKEHGM